MTPRWPLTLGFILLITGPILVTPQIEIIKTAVCVLCSLTFVVAKCAPDETFICRIIAFKLTLLDCRTFPCTNYGSPSQNSCASIPLGCLIWHVRVFGLCEPFQICCSTGGSIDGGDVYSSLSETKGPHVKRSRRQKRNLRWPGYLRQFHIKDKYSNTQSNKGLDDHNLHESGDQKHGLAHHGYKLPGVSNSSFHLPHTPEEYMEDWPKDESDPAVVEQMIKGQYNKLLRELDAINQQELDRGATTVRVPSFEEFHGVAHGKIPLRY